MAFQVQTHYREKVRQFYISQVLSNYSELVEQIVLNIHTLFGIVFQIQYLNDEKIWITLSETEQDMNDMFRCAQPVPSKRRSDEGLDCFEENLPTKKKRLKFASGDTGCLTSYKSPIDLDIENKRMEISQMENELLSRKNNCPNDFCVSAQMCGDVTKHEDETFELREIESKKQKLRRELRKEKQELELKVKSAEKINNSFGKQMEQELIESDRKKYLVSTAFDVKPRQALLNEHIAILERHYKGKIPVSLPAERQFFSKIICSALLKTPKETEMNPLRDMLSSNSTYPVRFPPTRIPPATACLTDPPLPPDLPPPLPPGSPPDPNSPFGYGWLLWPVSRGNIFTNTGSEEQETSGATSSQLQMFK